MQHLTYMVSMSPFHYTTRKDCATLWLLVNTQFPVCNSLTPIPMTVVFGLGMRQHVHMHTRLENGILRNGQQPGSTVKRAPCCDKHQFHANMTVST